MSDKARQKILLAYAIAEWDSAITHLETTQDLIGDEYTFAGIEAIGGLLDDLATFITYGVADGYLKSLDRKRAVAWARQYCTKHQAQLAQLLGE